MLATFLPFSTGTGNFFSLRLSENWPTLSLAIILELANCQPILVRIDLFDPERKP